MSQKSIALTRESQREAYHEAKAYVEEQLDDDASLTDGDLASIAFAALVATPGESGHDDLVAAVGSLDPSTPTCRNCGNHVTPKYVEVFTDATLTEGPEACPHCEDMIFSDGEYREKR